MPDGRVRDDVAVLAAAFAEDLLGHLRVHNWTYDPVDAKADPGELRQFWLPNGQHVAMLHQLSSPADPLRRRESRVAPSPGGLEGLAGWDVP